MLPLSQAITKTIAYAHRFGGSLTQAQLMDRLLSAQVYSEEEIINALKKGKIDLAKTTNDGQFGKKLKMAKQLIEPLTAIESILFIGLTGSVAAENCGENDDLDLLVITESNALWTTRIRVMLKLNSLSIPHRRYFQPETKDGLCLNLWLTTDSLTIISKRQTLTSAVDLIMMKPLFDRSHYYEEFLMANKWVKKYVATGYQRLISKNKFPMSNIKTSQAYWWKLVNWKCYLLQRIYMTGKIGKGTVDKEKAYFYP